MEAADDDGKPLRLEFVLLTKAAGGAPTAERHGPDPNGTFGFGSTAG
jgi:hypothetical protein